MFRNTLLTVSILLIPCHVHGQQVVVTPEETDEILVNPGMGWETFHHTAKQDKNLPSWIPSTVHYARWGAQYDGHPNIDHIDLGTVGWWGEWHMSQSTNAPMPTLETQRKIVDAYLAAFKKTPLVMLIGGDEMLKHAVQNGASWRADCLGDMGGFSKNWCQLAR